MPLKDLLKKKEKLAQPTETSQPVSPPLPHASEFRFMRTDTNVEEDIEPPTFDEDENSPSTIPASPKRGFGRFRKSSTASPESSPSRKEHRKLSQKLHITSKPKSRASSTGSTHVPSDLPDITVRIARSPSCWIMFLEWLPNMQDVSLGALSFFTALWSYSHWKYPYSFASSGRQAGGTWPRICQW